MQLKSEKNSDLFAQVLGLAFGSTQNQVWLLLGKELCVRNSPSVSTS
jgi:hypothetical protein